MKKYLMTGIAALALCVGFTSCSHDVEQFSEEEIQQFEVQKIKANYEKAFVKVFGTANNRDNWGFSDTNTRTRAHDDGRIDVNGNEWKTRPTVTAAEARAVFDYVNRVKTSIPHYSETAPDDLTTYYCTQVWGGNNHVESGVTDERTYPNYDQKQRGEAGNVYGPEKMNNLHIAMSTNKGEIGIDANGKLVGDWVHINNFNASENTNYGGNTGVVNGGTLDFAYESSEDSKYHNKWIIIDGQYTTDAEGVNHAGKYYVCFDFISCKNDVYTNFQKPGVGNVQVPGAYATVAEAIAAGAKDRSGDPVQSNWSIGNVTGGNMCIPANEIYTDWIIRLVNAQPTNNANLRVMAEDLSAGEVGDDFDFNDVVFDVYFSPTEGEAYVMVQAAGGTLPLRVHGTEVHGLFGQNAGANGLYPMINTHAEDKGLPGVSGLPAQRIQLTGITVNSKSDVNQKVKIEVQKTITVNGETIQQWIELENTGVAACKVGVDPTVITTWANERESFNTVCTFNQWVTGGVLEPTHPNN